MIVSLATVKAHLRVTHSAEDALITLYAEAAEKVAQNFINRNVYADDEALDAAVIDDTAGADPMVITGAITAAILLIAGHLYYNREDVVTGTSSTSAVALPLGSQYLLQPYRKGLGV